MVPGVSRDVNVIRMLNVIQSLERVDVQLAGWVLSVNTLVLLDDTHSTVRVIVPV